jgi:hypothetical protein
VSVPLNKIKTGKELLNVFYNVKMNYQVNAIYKGPFGAERNTLDDRIGDPRIQYTAKTKCRKFETNIPRKGILGPQSQFPHSCV